MAQVKEIRVNVGLTLNLGNYESARLDAGVTMDIKEGDDPKKVYEEAWKICEEEIQPQARDIKSRVAKSYNS